MNHIVSKLFLKKHGTAVQRMETNHENAAINTHSERGHRPRNT